MKKKLLSMLLVLCMVLTLLPASALAAEDEDGGTPPTVQEQIENENGEDNAPAAPADGAAAPGEGTSASEPEAPSQEPDKTEAPAGDEVKAEDPAGDGIAPAAENGIAPLADETVTETDGVAYTGDENNKTYYKTLSEAVTAANGSEITLIKDAKLTEDTTYTDVNINTNGHWIQVQKNAALTLSGANTKIGNQNSSADKPSIRVVGTLTIESGTYETTSSEFLIIWGTANISGGTFTTTHTATKDTDGRGFFAINGKDGDSPVNATLNMTAGTIEIKNAGTNKEAPHPIALFNGGTANLGAEDGTGPEVTGQYLAIGMNNTMSPANVNIYGGTYKTTSTASPEKFNAVVYFSAGGNFNIKGGTFTPASDAVAFSVPYTKAAANLNISGGEIGGAKALYVGSEAGTGSGSPSISITGGTFTEAPGTGENETKGSYAAYVAASCTVKQSGEKWTVSPAEGLTGDKSTGDDGKTTVAITGSAADGKVDSGSEGLGTETGSTGTKPTITVDATSTPSEGQTATPNAEVTIPAETAATMKDSVGAIEIKAAEDVSLKLPEDSVKKIAASTDEVTITVKKDTTTGNDVAAQYTVEVKGGTKDLLSGTGNGTITITVPAPENATNIYVYWVATTTSGGRGSSETLVPVEFERTDDGKIIISTSHLSTYQVRTTEATEGVAEASYINSEGNTTAGSLTDAITNSSAGTTITLLKECELSSEVTVDKAVTLDLNGKKVSRNSSFSGASMFKVSTNGNLTVKDSSATTAPSVDNDYTSVTYESGAIVASSSSTASGTTQVRADAIHVCGGTLTVESGKIEAGNIAVCVNLNTDNSATMNSKAVINGGYITGREGGVMVIYGGQLEVNGGVVEGTDNGGIMGNGTAKLANENTKVTVSGGTVIGKIASNGYSAVGIYWPQKGMLEIKGGEVVAVGGSAVVARAGSVTMSDGTVKSVGDFKSGKVGDASYSFDNGYGIVYDLKSNYPDKTDTDKVIVSGGNVGGVVGMIDSDSSTGGASSVVTVSGGQFSEAVDEKYLDDSINAELKKPDSVEYNYSYYTDASKAITEAIKTPGAEVKLVNTDQDESGEEVSLVTVTLRDGDTETKIQAPADTKITLPTPTKTGYTFNGWGIEKLKGEYTVPDKDITLEAQWTQNQTTPTTYTITATAGTGGSISPSGSVNVTSGGSQTFTVTANTGYRVDMVTVDSGTANLTNDQYTFSNVTANHSISVTFRYAGGGGGGGGSSSGGGSSGGGGGTSSGYAVSVPSRVTGGTVRVSPSRASRGTTVTITATPNSGYELDSLTVTDANGNRIQTTSAGSNRYTFTMPASRVTVEASFTAVNATPETPSTRVSFTDVQSGAYYYDAVAWAVEQGITSGTSATTFSPNASCTRAQMVTFLWRAAGSPTSRGDANPFTDVHSGTYYYDAVMWAVEQGITSGTSATTFSPDATVTRGQTVTFLYRAAGSPAAGGNNPFGDVASNAYYASAVQWAVGRGVTSGTSATTFSPNDDCTRAQIVTFLYRDRAN